MALWDSAGCRMPPDAPSRVGIDAIRQGMEPAFTNMNLELDLRSIDDASVFGAMGLTRCTYSLGATPKQGGDRVEVMPNGEALTLYKRQSDGSWKIVSDCFNSNVA